MTNDADLTLVTDFGNEEPFIDELLKHFGPRAHNSREFALQTPVLLLQHANGVPLDVALGALPFEARAIDRSSLWTAADGCELRTCSAEDLIVHKAFASRGKDWPDIDGILQRQGEKLNLNTVIEELEPLAELKEQPEILNQLRAALRQRGLTFEPQR